MQRDRTNSTFYTACSRQDYCDIACKRGKTAWGEGSDVLFLRHWGYFSSNILLIIAQTHYSHKFRSLTITLTYWHDAQQFSLSPNCKCPSHKCERLPKAHQYLVHLLLFWKHHLCASCLMGCGCQQLSKMNSTAAEMQTWSSCKSMHHLCQHVIMTNSYIL